MPTYTQANRSMTVTTPLGTDVLLLVGFSGQESLSHLFHYQLDLIAQNSATIAFDKLLGQSITVELELPGSKTPREKKRYFNGICYRLSQGERDREFTEYRMELVPKLWFLSKRAQSRIFQHLSVPDILKKVLTGLDVSYKLQGTFENRDYCVQYRETDFNFASRLMEEEGIYYYFAHDNGNHKLVVANTPGGHEDMPPSATVTYKNTEGPPEGEFVIYDWEKVQEVRSGKYTLWDHCFELPHKHLEASKSIQPDVAAGGVTHKLQVGGNGQLEIRDWPGEYAQRFDGVPKGGGDQAGELQKIFQDNARTVAIRMEEEAASSLLIQGAGNCSNFVAGHKFTLATLPDTLEKQFKADGSYVLTSLQHSAKISNYRSAEGGEFHYHNSFSCIPAALPYRPGRSTPKPVVHGTQTGVVVGPSGEEIFTDKYGRIKVQFHWDAEGQNNADSSCWVRVGTPWAGKQWGMIHIPRIGQEVIVAFEEGDPDKPIAIAGVYNAEMMPPYSLPDNKTQSGIKSRSSLKGTPDNFNEIRFEDKKGSEQLFIHAEKNQDIEVENDETHWVGHDRSKKIDHDERVSVQHDRTESVGNNENIAIGNDRTENVKRNEMISIGANRNTDIGKNEEISVGENRTESVSKDEKITIGGNREENVSKDEKLEVTGNRFDQIGKDDKQQIGKKFALVAGDEIMLQTGDASILMKSNGEIQIKGKDIMIVGSGKIAAKADGDMVLKGSKIAQN
jgi:type VI secretion system secreted protein VgrG